MITIYAQSFMTATRTGDVRMKGARPDEPAMGRRRWLPLGRWGRAKSRCADPAQLGRQP